MLTTANILIPQMRSPVASSSMPPTALKSAIIIGVVSGMISDAQAASVSWIISIGTQIAETANPSVQAKIVAVKKVEKGFGDQYAGIAGHPFTHGAENPGAAGAEQNNNGDIALNKRRIQLRLFLPAGVSHC